MTCPIDSDEGMLALNEAMEKLTQEMPRLADVVECRFFGGYGEEDTARALGVSLRTVQRDWLKARAWLFRELGGTASWRECGARSVLAARTVHGLAGSWRLRFYERSLAFQAGAMYRELIWPPDRSESPVHRAAGRRQGRHPLQVAGHDHPQVHAGHGAAGRDRALLQGRQAGRHSAAGTLHAWTAR